MTKLDDLSDDCLMEVLERLPPMNLFKMLRLNKRFKRLATTKISVKIQAISFSTYYICRSNHPGVIAHDQVLFLKTLFEDWDRALHHPSVKSFFLSLLTKCTSVKSIDFGQFNLPEGLLMDVFQRLPEVKCLLIKDSSLKIREWNKVFDRFGHQLVHFAKMVGNRNRFRDNWPTSARLLATVAKKCPNIQRVDWIIEGRLTRPLMAAFKKLPRNCWTTLDCYGLDEDVFEDHFDELVLDQLNWSVFGKRVDRLSMLYFYQLECSTFRGVEFAGLKSLDISASHEPNDNFGCLIASRFPVLEEFCFNSSVDINETDFNELFKWMSAVKKLIIYWDDPWEPDVNPYLPRLAILRLKKLETIKLEIFNINKKWEVNELLKPLELYVNEISSLKKLIIDKGYHSNDFWEEPLEELVERMKLKQDRVKIVVLPLFRRW